MIFKIFEKINVLKIIWKFIEIFAKFATKNLEENLTRFYEYLKTTRCKKVLHWEYTWAQMKPHCIVSPRCSSVDSASNLKHIPQTCSYAVQPNSVVVCPSNRALFVRFVWTILQFLLPWWCTGNLGSVTHMPHAHTFCQE